MKKVKPHEEKIFVMQVVKVAKSTEWPGWFVHLFECGHGTVIMDGSVKAGRQCRMCVLEVYRE